MFIIGIILAAIGVIMLLAAITGARGGGISEDRIWPFFVGIIGVLLTLLGGVFIFLSSYWVQDPGESNVLRSWSGEIVGYETKDGWHWKAPWVDVIVFDVRNQRAVYTGGDSQGDNSGGAADGPQITVQDAEGVTANIDIAIRYSIEPEAVVDIYKDYGTAENLRTRLIFNDIRSVVRDVPGDFSTLELLTSRAEVQLAILNALEKRWEGDGIIVNDVALQEIRYSDEVKGSFAAAAQAKIDVETAKANLQKAEVDAQQKVVQAQAESDANAILNASLSGAILQQRYLDTLAKLAQGGNLVVVPEGFNGLVNVSK